MNKTLEVRCYSKIIIEFKDGWGGGGMMWPSMKQTYCYHHKYYYFPKVFQSSDTPPISHYEPFFVIKKQHITFYPFTLTFNVMSMHKFVPVIIYVITAINNRFLTSLVFFFFSPREVKQTQKKKKKFLRPEVSSVGRTYRYKSLELETPS